MRACSENICAANENLETVSFYDDEGNLTKKSKGANAETWTYGYDHMNHLLWVEKRATEGGTLQMRADYKYDVFGNRIEKAVDADGAGPGSTLTTRFALDGWKAPKDSHGNQYPLVGNENWDVFADLNGSNQLQVRYVRGDQIDQLHARISSGGAVAWYLTDRLGSIRDITNSSGTVVDHLDYDGFGNTTITPSGGDRYLFTSREYDTESGLYFNRARAYDPRTGRWLTRDPLGFTAGDSNLYRYVQNTPVNVSDPSGEDPMPPMPGKPGSPEAGPGELGPFDFGGPTKDYLSFFGWAPKTSSIWFRGFGHPDTNSTLDYKVGLESGRFAADLTYKVFGLDTTKPILEVDTHVDSFQYVANVTWKESYLHYCFLKGANPEFHLDSHLTTPYADLFVYLNATKDGVREYAVGATKSIQTSFGTASYYIGSSSDQALVAGLFYKPTGTPLVFGATVGPMPAGLLDCHGNLDQMIDSMPTFTPSLWNPNQTISVGVGIKY